MQKLSYLTDQQIQDTSFRIGDDISFLFCFFIGNDLENNLYLTNLLTLSPISSYKNEQEALLINFQLVTENDNLYIFQIISLLGYVFQQNILQLNNSKFTFTIQNENSSQFYLYPQTDNDFPNNPNSTGILRGDTVYFSTLYRLLFKTYTTFSSQYVSFNQKIDSFNFFFLPANYRWSSEFTTDTLTPPSSVIDPQNLRRRNTIINIIIIIILFVIFILFLFFSLKVIFKNFK